MPVKIVHDGASASSGCRCTWASRPASLLARRAAPGGAFQGQSPSASAAGRGGAQRSRLDVRTARFGNAASGLRGGVLGEKRHFPSPVAGCYNHRMSMFRRRSGQPVYGPPVLQMQMAGAHRWFRTSVLVRPIARGVPRVYLSIGGYGFLTEDEVRKLAQALLDAIEQSKALTAQESS